MEWQFLRGEVPEGAGSGRSTRSSCWDKLHQFYESAQGLCPNRHHGHLFYRTQLLSVRQWNQGATAINAGVLVASNCTRATNLCNLHGRAALSDFELSWKGFGTRLPEVLGAIDKQ
jgi:hypothetical protein